MVEALVIGAAAGVLVALVVALRRRRRRRASPVPDADTRGVVTVTLDLSMDRDDPAPARRLAGAAAAPLFHDDPGLEQVEVRDRDGALLAIIERAEGLELAERDAFSGVGGADRLALPTAVRGALPEDPSLAEVVSAILAAAGHDVDVDGDVVRAGDRAVVALEATDPDALSAAFLRYRASGARTGVVVSRRTVPASEVQRRELLAPDLRYARAGALQRMADALAVGGDPIDFALGPPVSGR